MTGHFYNNTLLTGRYFDPCQVSGASQNSNSYLSFETFVTTALPDTPKSFEIIKSPWNKTLNWWEVFCCNNRSSLHKFCEVTLLRRDSSTGVFICIFSQDFSEQLFYITPAINRLNHRVNKTKCFTDFMF